MKTRYVIALAALAAVLAAATPGARAQEGGVLSTMPQGRYQCALPGDAGSVAYEVVESAGFRIGTASSYRNEAGRGTYILKGRTLTFTRGPKKGEKFRRVGTNQLQVIENGGSLGLMICTRLGSTS
ncbi:MAG: elongation factor P [Erythrobacter sp.]